MSKNPEKHRNIKKRHRQPDDAAEYQSRATSELWDESEAAARVVPAQEDGEGVSAPPRPPAG